MTKTLSYLLPWPIRMHCELSGERIIEEFSHRFSYYEQYKGEAARAPLLRVRSSKWVRRPNDMTCRVGNLELYGNSVLINATSGRIEITENSGDDYSVSYSEGLSPEALLYVVDLIFRYFLLRSGICLIHASGFIEDCRVKIFLGWGGSGKTSNLLSAMQQGAKYLSDDIIAARADGSVAMYPKPLNLMHYNLTDNIQLFAGCIDFRKRLLLYLHRCFAVSNKNRHSNLIARIVKKVLLRVENSLNIKLWPTEINPEFRTAADVWYDASLIDYKWTDLPPNVSLEMLEPSWEASRMARCLNHERSYLGEVFRMARYGNSKMEIFSTKLDHMEFDILNNFFCNLRRQ